MIRALVAAASPVIRAGLEAVLTKSTAVTVVAVSSTDTLADDIETHEPQVVLVALDSRDVSTNAIASRVALSPDAASRTPAFVLMVDEPTAIMAADALRGGARGLLPNDATPDEIVAAIEAAGSGLVTLPADIAADLASAARLPARQPDAATQPLSRREIEVLGMLAEGLANKNIAARLGISEHTVKTHVASILTKLDAFSRAEAVAIGARQGLILL